MHSPYGINKLVCKFSFSLQIQMPNHFHKPYLVCHFAWNNLDMVNEHCHFFAIDVVRGALDQMRQGLGTLDVLGVIPS